MDAQTLASNLVRALEQITATKEQLAMSEQEVLRLEKLVQGVQYTDPEFPAITRVEDDTGRVTFNKPRGYLLLPEPLVYPGVEVLPSATEIVLGGTGVGGLHLSPSPVWMYRFEGNKLFLSGSNGVYGEIVVGKSSGVFDVSMTDILFDGHPGQTEERDQYNRVTQVYIPASEGLIATVPPDPGKQPYRNDEVIFWSGNAAGRQVSLDTSVNGSSAVLRVGLFAVGQLAVLYSFAYDAARNAQVEDDLLALLRTATVQSKPIAIGF
jgi:hypothetical protein